MKLIFASSNAHKVKEIAALLSPEIEVLSLKEIGCTEEIPETGKTFEENAALKANYVAQKYDCDCIADDSGLEVDALDGAPGVYSARFAGNQATDNQNVDLLLHKLEGIEQRNAQFVTVIAYKFGNELKFFRGELGGKIIDTKLGKNGFGYDPIFIPDNLNQTLAQMDPSEKNTISHRAKAIAQLVQFIKQKA